MTDTAAPPRITYGAHQASPRPGETLLDLLLRQGADVTFSCRGGSCQACLMHCRSGQVPLEAQTGLPAAVAEAGYFLACQCLPEEDMLVARPDAQALNAIRAHAQHPGEEMPTPEPDPQLWEELDQGRQVRLVLEDFYRTVYADAQLSPFFAGVTPERVTGQQYAFLRQLMTGERVYFGDRPRNAHHWMVISDALLNHRQALMRAALERAGLSAGQIARWMRLEEHWRTDMVKSAPIPKVQHGQVYALEGFEREILSCGSLCDHCQAEIPEGTEVLFHKRLGTISCPQCAGTATHAAAGSA